MGLVEGKSNVAVLFGYFLPTGSTEHALFGTRDSGSAGSGEGKNLTTRSAYVDRGRGEKKLWPHVDRYLPSAASPQPRKSLTADFADLRG